MIQELTARIYIIMNLITKIGMGKSPLIQKE